MVQLQETPRPGRPPRGRDRILGVYVGDLNDFGHYVRRLFGSERAFDATYFEEKYAHLDPFEYDHTPYHELLRGLARYGLGRGPFKHLLDVGCGEGQLAQHLRDRVERISLLDASERALRRARARVGDDGGLDLAGDALDVLRTLPDATFDAMVIAEVLYYLVPNPLSSYSRALRDEVARVLAPGGGLVLMHPYAPLLHLPYRVSSRFKVWHRVEMRAFRSVEMLSLHRV